jgi:uncharacterized tellurite resistance protein B-like protein
LNDLINFYKDTNNIDALIQLGKITGSGSTELEKQTSVIEKQNQENE